MWKNVLITTSGTGVEMTFNVRQVQSNFPNLKRDIRGKKLVYLDSAATTLKPQCVIDAVTSHYTNSTSNIHRGVHFLSEEATLHYESTREKVRSFINAKELSEIIFTTGTTHGINLVAKGFVGTQFEAGDEIIITEMEHHANIVPWQMLCEEKGLKLKVAPMDDNGDIIRTKLTELYSSKTKFISLSFISNSLGTVNPIQEIIAEAHARNVLVLVDAAQAVANRTIDAQELNCDFLVFSAHKIFGPTGSGVLYGKRHLLEKTEPLFGGGDMIRSVTFEKTTYAPLPAKLEAGTPNIASVIGLGAAIDYVNSVGINSIHLYEKEIISYALEALSKVPGLKFIGNPKERANVISFVLDDIHPHDLGTLLDNEGVAIRTGHHCTQPVMKHFSVPATARASFSIYNEKSDVDALVAALLKAKELFA